MPPTTFQVRKLEAWRSEVAGPGRIPISQIPVQPSLCSPVNSLHSSSEAVSLVQIPHVRLRWHCPWPWPFSSYREGFLSTSGSLCQWLSVCGFRAHISGFHRLPSLSTEARNLRGWHVAAVPVISALTSSSYILKHRSLMAQRQFGCQHFLPCRYKEFVLLTPSLWISALHCVCF